MKLEMKSISSPDVELRSEEVLESDAVYFLVELEIGVTGDNRRDLFQVVVATPEGLRQDADAYATTPIIADRAVIVFANFSWNELDRALQRILDHCTGRDWRESVLRLQRYFLWEYEDYVQDADLE